MRWKKCLKELFRRYQYVLLVAAVGAALLLLPPIWGREDGEKTDEKDTPAQTAEAEVSVDELERRLAEALSRVQGVGEAEVVLTLKSGPRKILAQDSETSIRERETESSVSAVVISRGSGTEETVVVQQLSPQYQGALVICSGGDDPQVRLRLVEAVSALTGLGADKISVCKGK